MGSSSNKGTTTVTGTTSTQPWNASNMTDLQTKAKSLYDSGSGFNSYPGATYVAPNDNEMQGMAGVESAAKSGNTLTSGLISNAEQMLNGQGMASALSRIASGQDQITETAIGANNANVMDYLGRSAREASDSATGLFSAGGRYGGGAHQGTIADTVGGIYSQGLAEQYNKDADRLTSQQAANISNRGGAANSLMGQYNSIASNADDLNEQRYTDYRNLIDVGAAKRSEVQDELQSYQDAYAANDQEAIDRLNWLAAIYGGAGEMGSTGTATETTPKGSKISGLLGTAATGAGLAGLFKGLF